MLIIFRIKTSHTTRVYIKRDIFMYVFMEGTMKTVMMTLWGH